MGILQAVPLQQDQLILQSNHSKTFVPDLNFTMLFKTVLLATFASLALAAPGGGGEYDHGDYNWGKDKCYVKHYTNYYTETAYKDDVYYEKKTKTIPYEVPQVTKVPVTKVEYVEKKYVITKYKEEEEKYPVTKSNVKDEKVCKTKWQGNHWDYDGDKKW